MLDRNLIRYSTPHAKDRGFAAWSPEPGSVGAVVLAASLAQIERFRREDLLPTTSRSITYRLLARGLVHPKKGVPYAELPEGKDLLDGAVKDALQRGRRAGLVSFNDIDDAKVEYRIRRMFKDEAAFLDTLRDDIDNYCVDLIDGQPVRIEMVVETKGSVDLLLRICLDRGIRVAASGGDPGIKVQRLVAQRAVNDWLATKRPQIVFQIGDFDGGGVTGFHAFADNVFAFARHFEPGIDLSVQRVMLNEVQVMDDAFVEPTGRSVAVRTKKALHWPVGLPMAQLEAVDPAVFRAELVRVLDSHLDTDLLDAKHTESEATRDSIFARLGLSKHRGISPGHLSAMGELLDEEEE